MKYSPEKITEICRNLEQGMTQKDSAALSDISDETFHQWMKKTEFSDAVKKAALKCTQRNIAIIQKAAITTWQAAAWWLERRLPEQYALRQRFEHGGVNGEAIVFKMVDFSSVKFDDKKILAYNKTNGNNAAI